MEGRVLRAFCGEAVLLCPHKDNAGRNHMRAVACSLFPVAKKIKIVDLPFGKDLTEFCALRRTQEMFLRLVKTAPAVTAGQIASWRQIDPPSPDELEDKSLGELMAQPEQTVEWLCDGLLPYGGSSLFSAKAKVGKTTTARCLAAAYARSGVSGAQDEAGRGPLFLRIQERAATVRHFRKLGLSDDDPVRIISASITPRNFHAKLEKCIERHRPKLIVLDPYMRFLGIDDVNDYAKTMKTFSPIVSLATKYKVRVMNCPATWKS